ncbi:hypothetical protein A8B78_00890 [Jannaschia sp. EhC01]|nr:hypothetical protein A8B78_00890 [Jannaschia sp. EhC01]
MPQLSISPGFAWIVRKQRDFIAVRVAEITNVEVRAIRSAESRLAVVRTSSGKGSGVKITHLALITDVKCDHGSVPTRCWTAIEG